MDCQSEKCVNGYGPRIGSNGQWAMYREWLIDGLKKSGKTQRGLAAALGLDPTAITRMKTGDRKIQADELPKIAQYIGVSPPQAIGPLTATPGPSLEGAEIKEVHMRGALEAGYFRQIEDDVEAGLPKKVYVPMGRYHCLYGGNSWMVDQCKYRYLL